MLTTKHLAALPPAWAGKYAKMFKQKFGWSGKNPHISGSNHKSLI
jgi:hypothetical protein